MSETVHTGNAEARRLIPMEQVMPTLVRNSTTGVHDRNNYIRRHGNVQRSAPPISPSGTNIHGRLVGLWPSGEQGRQMQLYTTRSKRTHHTKTAQEQHHNGDDMMLRCACAGTSCPSRHYNEWSGVIKAHNHQTIRRRSRNLKGHTSCHATNAGIACTNRDEQNVRQWLL